ncbi:MAG: DUF296 domain-containing protein [Desulfuromonas sp.]|uniref:PCC domain-containing protein n=1 Tax=Desulfuromonas sp. TaxID=892 RepID=UPI000CCA4503|nr:PPC domain-containing DNA-binding protein [Desulfuromonas sp.]PLX86046.1 MAG: DUF296 domain-containing protein [Desulfuromonas sp.]
MEGYWFKEWVQGRRFVLKIEPGQSITSKLAAFGEAARVQNAVIVSAVGSVQKVLFRGIKAGAKRPITPPRMQLHELAGPLELLGLEGNLFPDENGRNDHHLHILVSKSSGEVCGGHLFDAEVFASCEILITEVLVEGVERHTSERGGVPTLFIEER